MEERHAVRQWPAGEVAVLGYPPPPAAQQQLVGQPAELVGVRRLDPPEVLVAYRRAALEPHRAREHEDRVPRQRQSLVVLRRPSYAGLGEVAPPGEAGRQWLGDELAGPAVRGHGRGARRGGPRRVRRGRLRGRPVAGSLVVELAVRARHAGHLAGAVDLRRVAGVAGAPPGSPVAPPIAPSPGPARLVGPVVVVVVVRASGVGDVGLVVLVVRPDEAAGVAPPSAGAPAALVREVVVAVVPVPAELLQDRTAHVVEEAEAGRRPAVPGPVSLAGPAPAAVPSAPAAVPPGRAGDRLGDPTGHRGRQGGGRGGRLVGPLAHGGERRLGRLLVGLVAAAASHAASHAGRACHSRGRETPAFSTALRERRGSRFLLFWKLPPQR